MELPKNELKILGKVVGTYTGWDELGVDVLTFSDFEPVEGLFAKADSITIDYTTGVATTWASEGLPEDEITHEFDVLTELKKL